MERDFRDKPAPINVPLALLPERPSVLDGAGSGWNQTGGMSIDIHTATVGEVQPVEVFDESMGQSEIRHEDLQVLSVVGHGSSGMVQKVLHKPSNSILALKVIPLVAEEKVRRAILLELRTLHESHCSAIVSFYGAYYREGAVQIALEYMDASLMDILKGTGAPIPEHILLAMCIPLLHGLVYLHKARRTIHRDIKPSNLLVDNQGNVKIADFGVSGELQSSLSKCASWVGTVHYMSPERICGGSYSFNSDLWSLGLSLLELALGRFPYSPLESTERLGFWDLLDFIVEEPVPPMPAHLSAPFAEFLALCLQKAPEKRPSSSDLLEHPWIRSAAHLDGAHLPNWIREALARLPPRGCEGDTERANLGSKGAAAITASVGSHLSR
ncbi:hypothetical protein KFE25_009082 [Diacronema lutheri]|uniref:mitogen-activated protein kinase kinase n=2 Tax=Diacronema lutheri TaxID=2081491 RepID=A0A8J6CH03_DIALT|nr:hypothetical protein KFE25_009082 [Diacronema lutheri]